MNPKPALRKVLALAWILLLASFVEVLGQTTSFTYQGRLQDGGIPATGTYDFQFRLFDASSGGSQIGPTLVRDDVTVTSGIFTVVLDFGGTAFPGSDRFLEIGVRPGTSTGTFTLLSPLQPLTSSPYALTSVNASNSQQLGGVPANQFVLTSDSRLTDARPPTPGSPNYIQNSNSQQANSNFSISGNGTAAGTLTANKYVVNSGFDGQTGPIESIHIQGPNSPANANSAQDLRFSFASAGSGVIRSFRGSNWDTYLQFLTNSFSQGSDVPQIRMHIDQNGNVGIGTVVPLAKLHVNGMIRVDTLAGGGTQSLCLNSSNQISSCILGPAAKLETGSVNTDPAQLVQTSFAHAPTSLLNTLQKQQTEIEILKAQNKELSLRLLKLEKRAGRKR